MLTCGMQLLGSILHQAFSFGVYTRMSEEIQIALTLVF
jgi:hypothetical protein